MKERIIRAVAGLIALISVVLTYFVNINWLWLGVFVGINLFQSSVTKFCPLEKILGYCGVEDKEIKKRGIKLIRNAAGHVRIQFSFITSANRCFNP